MRAAIKALIPDLSTYTPADSEVFGMSLELLIGPKESEGMESFQLTVCTPKWLLATMPPDRVLPGTHHLIVFDYNPRVIMQYLERYISTLDGETWEDLAKKLSKFGAWEFENYQAS